MTINIPLKAVAFVLYTLALLGGAFGISYAVFEWRDDDSDIERKLDALAVHTHTVETEAGPSTRLTAAEAAAKVPAYLVDSAGWEEDNAYRAVCVAGDFNQSSSAWVVTCASGGSILTFRVYDSTGRVEWVQ